MLALLLDSSHTLQWALQIVNGIDLIIHNCYESNRAVLLYSIWDEKDSPFISEPYKHEIAYHTVLFYQIQKLKK